MQGEEVLHGGNTNVVVRVGDTVHRQTGHWTPAVHALLAHLESVGFADAPTVLGIDDQGREILPFVIGEVGNFDPGHLPDWFRTTEACTAIGDWLRRFHDAQRGFTPDPSLPWRMYAGRALRDGEVVVHHDAAPYNSIRRADGGLTVIDWDFCAPGDPIEDLAWQWVPLWADAAVAVGHGGAVSVPESARRLAALAGTPRLLEVLSDDQARQRPRGDGGHRPRLRPTGRPWRGNAQRSVLALLSIERASVRSLMATARVEPTAHGCCTPSTRSCGRTRMTSKSLQRKVTRRS